MRATLLTLLAAGLLPIGLQAVDTTTVFNEVMYHPARASDAEWIELHNVMAVDMDLSGWRITGGVNFRFPEGTTIRAGGFLLVASHPAALQSSAGISGVLGPWTGALNNSSETIRLVNRIGRVMDDFTTKTRAASLSRRMEAGFPWQNGRRNSEAVILRTGRSADRSTVRQAT